MMDEKKVREAIADNLGFTKHLKKEVEFLKKEDCRKTLIDTYQGQIDICETIAESLEKQLPKKTKQSGVTTKDGVFHPTNGIDGVPYDLCPSCEENLCTDGILGRSKKYMKYCEMCGQRLDWSE